MLNRPNFMPDRKHRIIEDLVSYALTYDGIYIVCAMQSKVLLEALEPVLWHVIDKRGISVRMTRMGAKFRFSNDSIIHVFDVSDSDSMKGVEASIVWYDDEGLMTLAHESHYVKRILRGKACFPTVYIRSGTTEAERAKNLKCGSVVITQQEPEEGCSL